MIARRNGARTAADVNRLMIATFRANPAAFDGNINRLHNGALLTIPPSTDWQGLDAGEARHEVSRQIADWRQSQPRSATSEQARLRLVMPADGGTGGAAKPAAPAAAPAPAQVSPADAARAAAAEKQAADAKRLLEFKNAELARLQAQTKPAAVPAPKPEAAPAATTAAAPATAPPAAAPVTESAAAPAAKPAAPAKAPPAPAAAPGLLELLLENGWYVALGLVALLVAALAGLAFVRRRRDESTFDEALQPDAEVEHSTATMVTPTRTRGERGRDEILVEESEDESGEYVAPPLAGTAAHPVAAALPLGSLTEDTLGPDTALNLEQADPLAEADFHMAYGLYDQAADIVKLAIERDPLRRDLKLKLLEVYFVWGNKEAFLEVARELGRSRDQGPEAEWEKVVIMGRQLAADDPLFAGTALGGAAGADVDLDLESGGSGGMDLELLGDTGRHIARPPAPPVHDGGHAHAEADTSAETSEPPTIDPDRIDLLLDGEYPDHSGATTRELPARSDSPTAEHPAIAALSAAETPTVEMPALERHSEDDALLAKLGSSFKHDVATPADSTAELALDDLGFDPDKLGTSSTSLESLQATGSSEEGATLVSGLDDPSRHRLAGAADLEVTGEMPRPPPAELEATRETPRLPPAADETVISPPGPGHTERLPAVASEDDHTQRVLGTGALDLDLDELTRALESDTTAQPRRDEMRFVTDVFATGIHKAPNGIDLDVGASPPADGREPTVTERISAGDLDLPELEPVTLSEVGTKLDLARAYMDMGDPDGARSILQEVLNEGSASQRQEAQRLIETLPG